MKLVRRGKKGIWHAYIYRPNRPPLRRSLKTIDKRVAEYLAGQLVRDVRTNQLPTALRDYPLQDAIDRYLADCASRLRPLHVKKRRDRLQRLVDALHVTTLRGLTTERLRQVMQQLADTRKWEPRTYNHYRNDLHAFLNWCRHQQWLMENPVQAIGTRKVPKNPVRYLADEDISRCLAAFHGRWLERAVALAIYAGLRRSEIARLDWQDLDFEAKTIMVENKPEGLTKSGKFRVVPMSEGLAELLRPHRKPTGRVVGRVTQLTTPLWKARAKAKLPHWWNWLAFRHTFGTHCALRGVPLVKLAQWMGHHDPSVTNRYYIGRQISYDADIERFSPRLVHNLVHKSAGLVEKNGGDERI